MDYDYCCIMDTLYCMEIITMKPRYIKPAISRITDEGIKLNAAVKEFIDEAFGVETMAMVLDLSESEIRYIIKYWV